MRRPALQQLQERLRAGRLPLLCRQEHRVLFKPLRKRPGSLAQLVFRTQQGAFRRQLRRLPALRHRWCPHRAVPPRVRSPQEELPLPRQRFPPHRFRQQQQIPFSLVLPDRPRMWASWPGRVPVKGQVRPKLNRSDSRSPASSSLAPSSLAHSSPASRKLRPCQSRPHLLLVGAQALVRARRQRLRQNPQSKPPPGSLPQVLPCLQRREPPLRQQRLRHLSLQRHLSWPRVLASPLRQMPVSWRRMQPPTPCRGKVQAQPLSLPAPTHRYPSPCLLQPVQLAQAHGLPCPERRPRRSFRRWRAGPGL